MTGGPVGIVPFRIVPFGDAAVLVRLPGLSGIDAARRAQAVAAAIDGLRASHRALLDPVPAAASVLVPFDPLALTPDEAASLVAPVVGRAAADDLRPGRLHEIAVRYGGEDGPDLETVAAETGLATADVVELHASTTYEVLFLGFAPGFAYLGELPAAVVLPRLATPRPRVPAGSVAIAGPMTAVYPHESAGGWRLIGRTDVALFDVHASPPSLLRPGDRVRFVRAR